MTEYILYTRAKDEAEYLEIIEAISTNLSDISKLQRKAIQKGLITRVSTFKGEKPNFNNPNLINL